MPITVLKPAKPKPEDLAVLVKRSLRERELGKEHYAEADRLLNELATRLKDKDGAEIDLGNGKKAVLLDNWAGKSVVWGHGASRKWEILVL